ncbi:MAG: ATP-binding protein [Alphaproteobacteria bacterium]|nr:ATP-binding protein [Alphaproteobacteria bacterium]
MELINEVLDLAKIETGEVALSIEDINLKTVLNECLLLIKPIADKNNIEIVVGDAFNSALWIKADQTRIKQCLLNLLSNAVKYNLEDGKIVVDCCEIAEGKIRISVTDTGIGIPEHRLSELFEPFSRLKAESTAVEGTGIGLAITKNLTEMMDGCIGVESFLGQGSTFWIEFPLALRENKDDEGVSPETNKDGNKIFPNISGTLLYVEDNPTNLLLVQMIIDRFDGLSMISADDAELGIELAIKNKPDLIIMDINLPGMDGYEALKKLQSMDETKDIPVIALSANAMPEDLEKGAKAGFRKYITKPIAVARMVENIKEVFDA